MCTSSPTAAEHPLDRERSSRERRRVLVLACVAYFVRFVSLGTFAPYVMLWLTDYGGHPVPVAGALVSLSQGIRFISPALIGGLADARRWHLPLLMAGGIINAFAVAAITLWPSSVAWQATTLSVVALSDISSLIDAIVVRSLGYSGAKDRVPNARAFGALGWVCVAPVFGTLAGAYGLRVLFLLFVPLSLLLLPVCCAMPIRRAYGSEGVAKQTSTGEPPAPLASASFFVRLRHVCSWQTVRRRPSLRNARAMCMRARHAHAASLRRR